MSSIVELKKQVKAVNIVDVIRRFEPLKKRGAEWQCLCPFHTEKSPSFQVNPAKQMFKCFGCGAGGDVIEFIMLHQRVDYMAALMLIASLENIPVSYQVDEGWKGAGQGAAHKVTPVDAKFVEKAILGRTLSHYEHNPFFQWLACLVGVERAVDACLRFYVGTAKQGGTIFWQVDQFMRVRTGQKIHYGADGHRRKDVDIKRLYRQDDKYYPCLYGEHQLLQAERETRIVVVESEKTAIICDLWQPCGPNCIYMASVGMNGMTDEKLWPLKGLRVVLCPDNSFVSRATWGAVSMRKKPNDKGRTVPAPDGEEDKEYVSVAMRLQRLGCEVAFFVPNPELTDGSDIADVLVQTAAPGPPLAMPALAGLTLEEMAFE